jgi:hypothetical protein
LLAARTLPPPSAVHCASSAKRASRAGLALAHLGARAVHELAAGGLAPAQHGGHLGVVAVKHVVQQEGRALVGREAFQHHQQRHRQVAGQLGARVGGRRRVGRDPGLGQPGAVVGRALGARGAQAVQAQPRDGGRQPGLGRVHALGRRGLPAQPGVLQHVVGIGAAAQHAVGHAGQARAVLLEDGGVRVRRDGGGGGRCHAHAHKTAGTRIV